MTEAFNMGLTIEEADAVFGRPMGIPKTGAFGLYDLIGLDLMVDVLKSFIKELPKDDPFHEVVQENPLITKLIDEGYTGRKGKGGFYRMNKESGKKTLEAINLETGKYALSQKIDLEMSNKVDIQKLISRDDKYGRYAWSVISKIINYAVSLIPNVTSRHNNIDEAMRLGFNWSIGPFEMLDEIGLFKFAEMDESIKNTGFYEAIHYTKDTNKPYSGPVFSLYENGQKKEEVTLKDGKEEGKWILWYDNGQKMYEGTFKDGDSTDVWTGWYENGQKKWEGTYKDGELISEKCWDQDGDECECSESGPGCAQPPPKGIG